LVSDSSEASISNANNPYDQQTDLFSRYGLSPPSTKYEAPLYSRELFEENPYGAPGKSSNPPSTLVSRSEGVSNIYSSGLYYRERIHEDRYNTQAHSDSAPEKSSYSTSGLNAYSPEVPLIISPVTPNIRRREQDEARRDMLTGAVDGINQFSDT
jgi:hypothetical protein